jgi:molecular chaperone IbpA
LPIRRETVWSDTAKKFSKTLVDPLEIRKSFFNFSAPLDRGTGPALVGVRSDRAPSTCLGVPDDHVAQVEDVAMRTFDLTPFWRSTVGFDRLFELMDQASSGSTDDNYPPYNIERTGDDQYRISLALAGFSPDEVTITAEQNVLSVEGTKAQKRDTEYLYQGISARPFRRVFNLADYVQVKGANFVNGLLQVDLVREVPEAMKPRRIAINGTTPPAVEHRNAA